LRERPDGVAARAAKTRRDRARPFRPRAEHADLGHDRASVTPD